MAEPQKCMIAEEMLWLIEEPQVLPSLPAGVVYFEISRFGGVQIHEMTRARLLLNAAADRGAAFPPTAETVEEAYCCLRAKVHQLETFDTLALAEHWAAPATAGSAPRRYAPSFAATSCAAPAIARCSRQHEQWDGSIKVGP